MGLRRSVARGQHTLSKVGFCAAAAMYLLALVGHPADGLWVFATLHVGALLLFFVTGYWIFELTDETCRGPGSFSWEHVWRGSPTRPVQFFKIAFSVALGGALVARYVVGASERVASALTFAAVWMGFYGVSALTTLSWLRVRGVWANG